MGEVSLYNLGIYLLFDWFRISCMTTDIFCFYLQNRLIQTSQTGGQRYSNTSPCSIPWALSSMRKMFMKIMTGVNLTKAFFHRYSSSGEECLPLACKNILVDTKDLSWTTL
jgi:hypothetical protein